MKELDERSVASRAVRVRCNENVGTKKEGYRVANILGRTSSLPQVFGEHTSADCVAVKHQTLYL